MPLRLVLVRPRNAENVGAVARAMRNFAVSDWVLVQPEVADLGPAQRTAVHAGELLEQVQVAESLADAVKDCVWIVGTSSRHVRGKRRLGPREAAEELARRDAEGTLALVFGDERSGLSNQDVDLCHDLSSVAAEMAQPSLNLAQAALLYCYEFHAAKRTLRPPLPPPHAPLATQEELEGIEDALRRALDRAGFLRVDEARALRELLTPLRRGKLLRREAALWRAALESLGKIP
jgi:TrmH family RNA methyltransferase